MSKFQKPQLLRPTEARNTIEENAAQISDDLGWRGIWMQVTKTLWVIRIRLFHGLDTIMPSFYEDCMMISNSENLFVLQFIDDTDEFFHNLNLTEFCWMTNLFEIFFS